MSLLLGIDLGSTSIKAVAYDLQGNAVALASRPTVVHRPHPEHPTWAIAKPEEVWACAADSVAEVVAKIGDAKRIKALAVTGQGMDGVPIDSAGRVIYPFISWHCPRTTPQQKWWLENIGAEKTFAITGNPVWACNPALRLLWMKENEGEILAKTTKWLLIEDFLNFMLTGEKVTDYTMASNTLLFDQRKQVYSPELLERSGIDRGLLCDAKPSGTIIGQVNRAAADRTGLAAGTPVVLGGHDFLCGCLPVGAFEPGVVLDVCGTWEIVVTAIAQPVLTDAVREMGWWVDSHVARGVWSAMGSAVAADMLEWFRKLFGYEEAQKAKTQGGVDWDYLMAAASAVAPGCDGVMFLPHMSGSTIPVPDPQSAGAFVGLRNHATKGHILRAVVEGLNFQTLQIMEGIEKGLLTRLTKLVAVGGGTSNTLWMQNKADMLGCPVEAPAVEEATPLGAAILAGIGIGLYRDERDAFKSVYRPGKIYTPNEKLTPLYARRYEVFKQIYPALKPISAQLGAGA